MRLLTDLVPAAASKAVQLHLSELALGTPSQTWRRKKLQRLFGAQEG